MADLGEDFVLADIPADDRSFEPLPKGNYRLQVIESRIDDTKSGTGQMLTLTLEVIEGQYKGRRIWDRLNIRNTNPEAQRIALVAHAKLCRLVGIKENKDARESENLHFKPFTAQVTIQEDKSGQYGPQNRVRYPDPGTGSRSGGQPATGQALGKSSTPTAGMAAKPWQQGSAKKAAPTADTLPNDDIPF